MVKEERAQKAHLKTHPKAAVSLAQRTACAPLPLCHTPLSSSVELFLALQPSPLMKGDIYLDENSSRNLKIKTSLTEFYRLPCTLIYPHSKIYIFFQLLKLFSDNVSSDHSKGFLSFIFTVFIVF